MWQAGLLLLSDRKNNKCYIGVVKFGIRSWKMRLFINFLYLSHNVRRSGKLFCLPVYISLLAKKCFCYLPTILKNENYCHFTTRAAILDFSWGLNCYAKMVRNWHTEQQIHSCLNDVVTFELSGWISRISKICSEN